MKPHYKWTPCGPVFIGYRVAKGRRIPADWLKRCFW